MVAQTNLRLLNYLTRLNRRKSEQLEVEWVNKIRSNEVLLQARMTQSRMDALYCIVGILQKAERPQRDHRKRRFDPTGVTASPVNWFLCQLALGLTQNAEKDGKAWWTAISWLLRCNKKGNTSKSKKLYVPPSPQSLLAFYHSPISSEMLLQYRFSRNHFLCGSWSRQQRCHQDGLSLHRPGPRAQRPCPALPQPVQLWASSQVPSCQQNLAAKGMLLEQGHRALQGSTHESNSEEQGGWKRTSP